jgi:hypothetical protein
MTININSGSILNIIEKIANIVTATSFVVAILSYLYTKKQDKNKSALEIIHFFRSEIITHNENLIAKIKELKGEQYFVKSIFLENVSIEFGREKFPNELLEQAHISSDNPKIFALQVLLLNMLTELALKIKYSKTIKHSSLNCIKPAFTTLFEQNVGMILMHNQILNDKAVYQDVIDLYDEWKMNIDRRSPKERVENLGNTQL